VNNKRKLTNVWSYWNIFFGTSLFKKVIPRYS
jgi:hypothetical protein